jgi:hypothetical protein
MELETVYYHMCCHFRPFTFFIRSVSLQNIDSIFTVFLFAVDYDETCAANVELFPAWAQFAYFVSWASNAFLFARSPVSIFMVVVDLVVISETCCRGQERHLIGWRPSLKGFRLYECCSTGFFWSTARLQSFLNINEITTENLCSFWLRGAFIWTK